MHVITYDDTPQTYQIRLMGQLDSTWSAWFEGAQIAYEANGDTRVTCVVVDQAALFGLLKKIRDVGLPLLSITRVEKTD